MFNVPVDYRNRHGNTSIVCITISSYSLRIVYPNNLVTVEIIAQKLPYKIIF